MSSTLSSSYYSGSLSRDNDFRQLTSSYLTRPQSQLRYSKVTTPVSVLSKSSSFSSSVGSKTISPSYSYERISSLSSNSVGKIGSSTSFGDKIGGINLSSTISDRPTRYSNNYSRYLGNRKKLPTYDIKKRPSRPSISSNRYKDYNSSQTTILSALPSTKSRYTMEYSKSELSLDGATSNCNGISSRNDRSLTPRSSSISRFKSFDKNIDGKLCKNAICSNSYEKVIGEQRSAGLRNFGNTCYMNAVLQCLSHTAPLSNKILDGNLDVDGNGKLLRAFDSLLRQLWADPSNYVSAASFRSACSGLLPSRFFTYNQQDAHEFMRFLIDILHAEVKESNMKSVFTCESSSSILDHQLAAQYWKRYSTNENSFIIDFFAGLLQSTLECTECHHRSITFEVFWDISLPIPESRYSNSFTLTELLHNFIQQEILDGVNKPTCSSCKKQQKMVKGYTFHRLPKCLVFHLKRFSVGSSATTKVYSNVDFPLNQLNMNPYLSQSVKSASSLYNLYAVAYHSGTLSGGHYTATCKHPVTGLWYHFDDSRVSDLISADKVSSSDAYLLFYEMVGIHSLNFFPL